MRLLTRMAAHVAAWTAGRQMARFFEATAYLRDVQQRLLRRQLLLTAGSDFARDFGLDGVDTAEDYKRRVPILRYDRLKPYIERLKAGQTRALFGPSETLLMFALTSGTTAEPKFIPVTRRSIGDYRRGWNVFGLKALLDHPEAILRPIVQITSLAREIQTPGGTWAGAITGLLAETQKWIVRRHYVTPLAVARIKDPTAKMYTVAYLACRRDVAFINTANPSTTLRLAQVMDQYAEALIRDIHDGEFRPPAPVPPDVIAGLSLPADRRTAARLTQIRHTTGRLLPKDVWNLSFINNWTGGTLKLYLQRFSEYFGSTPVRDLGLLASEGRFSIPIDDHTPAGILDITSNFCEFIPEAEHDRENPPTLAPDQVKVGEKYFLVFSNATGLCRYDIGDLVRVTGFYGQTPMIEFLNKGAHTCSVTGEKVTERQVVEAMGLANEKLGVRIDSFLVQSHWGDPPYYVLTIEQSAAGDHTGQLATLFDECLRRLNIEYEAKRASHRLGPVQLRQVAAGFFRDDDLKKLAATGRSEQYKRKFLLPEVLS